MIRNEWREGTDKRIRVYACRCITSWFWKPERTARRADLTLTICLNYRST